MEVAIEANDHCVVGKCVGNELHCVDAVLARRNSYIDWSSLCTELQTALRKDNRYAVCCTLQSCQLACCAVNAECTCDSTLSLDNNRCKSYITLNCKAKSTCKMVELNRSYGLLALGRLNCVGVHRSRLWSKCAHGVRLRSKEVHRLHALRDHRNGRLLGRLICNLLIDCYSCRSRIDDVVRIRQLLSEAECRIYRTACCQWERIYAVDSDSIALTPIDRIDSVSLLAELSTRALQRESYLVCSTLVDLEVHSEVLGCICYARKCEHSRGNHQEKFC